MATYTDNYQLTKPLYSEVADIVTINNNMDKVDDIMHNSQISLADAYDQTQTYELGEKVMYEMLLYRCISRIETPEVWNPDHWERTTAADEGGNYVDITPTYQSGLKIADTNIDGDLDEINVPYMTGATSLANGTAGLPPAPQAGDEDKFLKGNGSWGDVAGSAEDIDYDNTESGLESDDVQGAIDGLANDLTKIETDVLQIDSQERWDTLCTASNSEHSQMLSVLSGFLRSPTSSYPGCISSGANYQTFYFQASENMQIYATGQSNLRLRVSNEEPELGNSKVWTGSLYATDDNSLPTENNPVSVTARQYVAFFSSASSFTITIFKKVGGAQTYSLKNTLDLTSTMQNSVNTQVNKNDAIYRNKRDVFNPTWGIGNFSITSGADIRGNLDGTTSRRSCDTINVPYPVAVGVDTSYLFRMSIADSDYEITSTDSFGKGKFVTIPANTPFRITLRIYEDSDISDVTDATLNQHIYIYGLFPNGYAPVKWCAMGDSITQGWYSWNDGNSVSSETDASKTWTSKVATANGWDIKNMGIGSTGWLDTVSEGDYTTAGFYLATHTDFSPYNLVTLAYGVNDWKANLPVGSYEDAPDGNTPTTVMQAMRMTIEGIMASNPKCKIIVILPLNCAGYSYAYGDKSTNYGLGYEFSNSGTLESFVRKMIEVCNYYGVQYIDQTHYSCINRENLLTMLPDGVHPSADAHILIANELSKKITI